MKHDTRSRSDQTAAMRFILVVDRPFSVDLGPRLAGMENDIPYVSISTDVYLFVVYRSTQTKVKF